MLAYDKSDSLNQPMTKLAVLEVFARAHGLISPDRLRLGLQPAPDRRSVYSYLLRLKHQGMLETGTNIKRGHLVVVVQFEIFREKKPAGAESARHDDSGKEVVIPAGFDLFPTTSMQYAESICL